MTVTVARLSPAVLDALAAGDAGTASRLSPVPLSPWLTGPECRDIWQRRARQVAAAPEDEGWVTGVVLDDGEPVGRAGFHAAPDTDGTVEVGYAIDPAHRRRGLARTTLTVLLDRAREAPGVRRVLASVGPWNEPSLRLVRASGFQQIGERIDDEDGLELVFALDVPPPG
jgi:ribosomal-protein-alanine N-acetyltransferase